MSNITASDFGKLIAEGKTAHIVDVRTPAEFEECHVAGARLVPLDALDPRKVVDDIKPGDATIYLLCKGGTRAGKAAEKFREAGFANVCVVSGGTEACVASGLNVARGAKMAIPLDGQVRIAIGGIILLCWLLAYLGVPFVGYLVPLMGAGLIFSGVTGFCGLAILLGKAPWNQCKR